MVFNPKLVSNAFSREWSNVAYRRGNLMLLWLTGE